jgi:hypothetical protein
MIGSEERPGLVDLLREPLGMGRREIALEGRRLDGVPRQHGQQERATRQRLAIGAERGAPRPLDLLHERSDLDGVEGESDVAGGETTRFTGRGQALARRGGPLRGLLPGRSRLLASGHRREPSGTNAPITASTTRSRSASSSARPRTTQRYWSEPVSRTGTIAASRPSASSPRAIARSTRATIASARGPKKARAEELGEAGVAERVGREGGDETAPCRGSEALRVRGEDGEQIGPDGARIRNRRMGLDGADHGFVEQHALVGPTPVERGLRDARALGDRLDRDRVVTDLLLEGPGGSEDPLVDPDRTRTRRAPRGGAASDGEIGVDGRAGAIYGTNVRK